MYIRLLALIIWFSSISRLAAAQEAYQVNDYEIKFFIKNAGITVEGSLDSLEAKVLFHPRKPNKSQITASVAPGTIQTGIKIRDKHLKRSDYFDVERYPRINLESLGFTRAAQDTITGRFALTIKDVTQKITVPIHFVSAGNTLQLDGTFSVNRLDFGLGGKSIILADEVDVVLNARLERLDL